MTRRILTPVLAATALALVVAVPAQATGRNPGVSCTAVSLETYDFKSDADAHLVVKAGGSTVARSDKHMQAPGGIFYVDHGQQPGALLHIDAWWNGPKVGGSYHADLYVPTNCSAPPPSVPVPPVVVPPVVTPPLPPTEPPVTPPKPRPRKPHVKRCKHGEKRTVKHGKVYCHVIERHAPPEVAG